jgi:hypothetical protein
MTERDTEPRDLLAAEPGDPGCAAGATVLDAFVELELSGADPARTYPAWATHLRSCPGCHTDYEGLLEAARLFGDA